MPLDTSDHSDAARALLDEHVVAYRLDGPLFFGAAHRFLLELSEVGDVRVVILRLGRVQTLDATGATVLGQTIRDLEGRGITVLLSGIRDDHDTVFSTLGVLQTPRARGARVPDDARGDRARPPPPRPHPPLTQ